MKNTRATCARELINVRRVPRDEAVRSCRCGFFPRPDFSRLRVEQMRPRRIYDSFARYLRCVVACATTAQDYTPILTLIRPSGESLWLALRWVNLSTPVTPAGVSPRLIIIPTHAKLFVLEIIPRALHAPQCRKRPLCVFVNLQLATCNS